ncbi:hypothetical protein EDD18DRAFT_1312571 [Armillaria luteobubalina]|uniref:CxC2-like cysteine cluster KDZ transposase-associated domain-containing protein n=1 Tax=Armillaria luteobubalina TaxID=153913 RepID=A0AA39U6N7_9AGAR|nr:hypothetical protein EDD18DRAFT_1312571 [Armillaria luteobubalina]
MVCENDGLFYRCLTCQDARLFCQSCIVTAHLCSPTHIIQARYWNGDYFDKTLLRNLGLRYQVGHLVGEACPHPWPAFGSRFTIIDMNSIHDVALDFCHCLRERPLAIQLQRAWLFPGTVKEPCIVVTVAALEQFQMLTFMGKVSVYEYYHSLARLSDNTSMKMPPISFIHIVREWSFIRLLKRARIGNNASRWEAAKAASCAVECLACPHPGINIPVKSDPNLPTAWEDTLFVSVDANFKLERFDMSSKEKDPGLGQGLSYFVDTKAFKNHLIKFDKCIIQPRSTCNNHEAAKGDKKTHARSRALAASRVGGVICTHHELKLPLSTVDLQVGEIRNGLWIVTTYNIACQWSINLEDHINIYGLYMAPLPCDMLYLVPKFHLPGHIKACQEKYCMSFHIHVGNNDGEAPERSWAISNVVAASTWEMSLGHRREKLDQHFGDVNWQKNVSMGTSLLRKIKDAVPNAAEFESCFERFTTTLPTDDTAKWTAMVESWEADREQFNPFARVVASKSEAAMCLQLAREDAQDEEGDQLYIMSPKDMIVQGVQIEASQINKELGEHSTDLQQAQQEVHMPVVCSLRICDSEGNGPSLPTYSQPLYLPSAVLLHHPCNDVVVHAEARLCIGQGFDLLHTIPKGYKDADATMLTQKERLKCHKTTRDLNMRIMQAKYYYRDVRQCLMTLSTRMMEYSWQSQLRVLEDSDGMSWIWYAAHLGDVPGGVNEYLRIEWCKAHARAHHWREECKLVNADMQHVKHTLEHDADLWLSRAKSGMEGGAFVMAGEGAAAYAKCQAAIHVTIKSSFEHKWRYVEDWIALGETDKTLAVDDENPFI